MAPHFPEVADATEDASENAKWSCNHLPNFGVFSPSGVLASPNCKHKSYSGMVAHTSCDLLAGVVVEEQEMDAIFPRSHLAVPTDVPHMCIHMVHVVHIPHVPHAPTWLCPHVPTPVPHISHLCVSTHVCTSHLPPVCVPTHVPTHLYHTSTPTPCTTTCVYAMHLHMHHHLHLQQAKTVSTLYTI